MKRFFLIIFPAFLALSSFSVIPTLAQGISAGSTGISTTATAAGYDSAQDPAKLIGGVIKVALGVVGFIFFAYTLYAGFLWMTAAGNPENVEKAQGMIKNGVIGFLVIASAYSIASFVVTQISAATSGTASSSTSTTK